MDEEAEMLRGFLDERRPATFVRWIGLLRGKNGPQ
jgi:hypothetical protein